MFVMGTMKVTAENLTAKNLPVNLCNIVGDIGYMVSDQIDYEIDRLADDIFQCEGVPENFDLMGHVSWDYPKAFAMTADYVRDFLLEECDEIFDGTVVQLGEISETVPSKDYFSYRDYVECNITIDGEKLFKIAQESGITEIPDGHDVSGFIRTCNDNYWTICKVLAQLVDDDMLVYYVQECFAAYSPELVECELPFEIDYDTNTIVPLEQ